MDSDSLRNMCDARSRIVESIRSIRIEPNKTFRQVEVSESTMLSATKFIKAAPNICEIDGRHVYLRYGVLYSMGMGPGDSDNIYQLLSRDAGDTAALQADQKFQNWEDAVQHLLRYALYLLLAPRRPEFQSIKLYSSFYVYQVAKKLNGAEKILMAMGYKVPGNRSSRDADELKIEGEVDLDHVARTAADLVILQCDLKLLKGNVKAIGREYPSARIADVLEARSMKEQTYGNTYEEAVGRAMFRLNPTQHSSSGGNAPYYTSSTVNADSCYTDSKRQPHPQAYATEQSNSNVLPVSTPHVMDDFDRKRELTHTNNGSGPNLLPRSAMGNQKSKQLIHYDSAPLLDDTSTQDSDLHKAMSPDGSKQRLRKKSGSEGNLLERGGIGSGGGNTSSRAQMQGEGLWRTEECAMIGTQLVRQASALDHICTQWDHLMT